MKILVTGGAGFIGSALVRQLIEQTKHEVVNVDKLTYAGSKESLERACRHPRHFFEHVDISDASELERVFGHYKPDRLVHLAAESHVDRSIASPRAFIETNVLGTCVLLEVTRKYVDALPVQRRRKFCFLHVSTDEVYGDIGWATAPANESANYAPSSPYAATKAAADHLARAWHRTYGLPVTVVNCSNNYGPYQYPEKLIPLMIARALQGEELPVYGDGRHVRDWLYVEDNARALRCVLMHGRSGRTYNIGGNNERTNLQVVHALCRLLDDLLPDPGGSYQRLIRAFQDRPGHDKRYALDNTRITTELGWVPEEPFESGLEKTVRWYLSHLGWLRGRNADRRAVTAV